MRLLGNGDKREYARFRLHRSPRELRRARRGGDLRAHGLGEEREEAVELGLAPTAGVPQELADPRLGHRAAQQRLRERLGRVERPRHQRAFLALAATAPKKPFWALVSGWPRTSLSARICRAFCGLGASLR